MLIKKERAFEVCPVCPVAASLMLQEVLFGSSYLRVGGSLSWVFTELSSDYRRREEHFCHPPCFAWPLPCTRVVLSAGLSQADFQADESPCPSTSSSSWIKADSFGNLWVPQATSQKAVSSEVHTHSLQFKRQIQGKERGCLCFLSSDKEESQREWSFSLKGQSLWFPNSEPAYRGLTKPR